MNVTPTSRPQFFGLLAGLALAAGLVFASLVVAGTWTRISESQVINVNGSARKNVHSDLVLWHASYSVDAATLLEAQQKLQADYAHITAFLQARGLTEFIAQPVQIRDITAHQRNNDDDTTNSVRVGYHLSQAIVVRSTEVDRVPKLAGDSGELLQQGIAFVSESFEFIYTKAGDAKVEMMAEATKDALARAEQIAAQGGRKIKELRSARMGVVQINPLYSSSTSWEGNNDTTALEKTITATVGATFSLK